MAPAADSSPWVALLTLTAMEIVLGVDNIVFIAILVARLPADKRERVRKLGIGLALVIRIGLLFALSWLMGLTRPLFSVLGQELSGRDLILLVGGLFLVGKSAHEMHAKLEGPEEGDVAAGGRGGGGAGGGPRRRWGRCSRRSSRWTSSSRWTRSSRRWGWRASCG